LLPNHRIAESAQGVDDTIWPLDIDERAKVVSACQAPHLSKIRHNYRTLGQARQDHYATHPRLTMVAEPYDIRGSKYLRLERVVNKPVNNFQHATRAQRYKLGPLQ
jgi:hypothetical protein